MKIIRGNLDAIHLGHTELAEVCVLEVELPDFDFVNSGNFSHSPLINAIIMIFKIDKLDRTTPECIGFQMIPFIILGNSSIKVIGDSAKKRIVSALQYVNEEDPCCVKGFKNNLFRFTLPQVCVVTNGEQETEKWVCLYRVVNTMVRIIHLFLPKKRIETRTGNWNVNCELASINHHHIGFTDDPCFFHHCL